MRQASRRSALLLWNMENIARDNWGIVPSLGGKLVEPYRSNLIRFVSDIKTAGFTGLTISFLYRVGRTTLETTKPPGAWDPTKLDENWKLLEDVHKLAQPFALATMHYDPIQEGAPSIYQPPAVVVEFYIATMWTRYAPEFGKDDMTVAVIAKGGRADWNDRMENLLLAFRSTGLGYPAYFEVHPTWTSPEAYNDLIAVDNVLRAYGLMTQPLVIGESSYENAAVAGVLRASCATVADRFQRSTSGGIPPKAAPVSQRRTALMPTLRRSRAGRSLPRPRRRCRCRRLQS